MSSLREGDRRQAVLPTNHMGESFLALSDRGKNGGARWIGGTLVLLFFWLIVGSIMTLPFLLLSGVLATGDLMQGDPFWTYIATNVSFFGIWIGLFLVMRFLHRRPLRTLVTGAPGIHWGRLAQGFLAWLVLIALGQAAEFALYPERIRVTFEVTRWLTFLPFVLILTPIQTSAEELLFRGYWLQGTGRLTRNAIALVALNGLLFAVPHMLNPEVTSNPGDALILFAGYAVTGGVLALYTLRDNRLELALGAHMANNLFAALAVNYTDSALTTPAVVTNTTLDARFGLVSLMFVAAAFYVIVFVGLDRRATVLTHE